MFSPTTYYSQTLITQAPPLTYKNRGISINQSGTLQTTGSITDFEKEFLEQKLNQSEELVSAINDFKSSYLEYFVAENRGYGSYDVADVFNFREMLESSRRNEDFKQTWEYETNWLKLTDNILSQLRRNAPKH